MGLVRNYDDVLISGGTVHTFPDGKVGRWSLNALESGQFQSMFIGQGFISSPEFQEVFSTDTIQARTEIIVTASLYASPGLDPFGGATTNFTPWESALEFASEQIRGVNFTTGIFEASHPFPDPVSYTFDPPESSSRFSVTILGPFNASADLVQFNFDNSFGGGTGDVEYPLFGIAGVKVIARYIPNVRPNATLGAKTARGRFLR